MNADEITDEMVEAAAEVLSVDATGFFQFNGPDIRQRYRDLARRCLTAAATGRPVHAALCLRWPGKCSVYMHGHRCANPPDRPHQCACGTTT